MATTTNTTTNNNTNNNNGNEVFAVEGETDAISGPMVFSCIKCHVIVGDSFSYLKSSADMNTLTLSGASHVSRSADVYTSKSGPDVGSTYFRFNCSSCQAALGRYYLTTSKDLDDLREKFTFTVDSLESYELGKAQHGKVPEIMTENVGSSSNAGSSSSSGDGQGDDGNNEYVPTGIDSEVLKIQHVMFDLLERMMRQEQSTQRITQLTNHLSVLVRDGVPPTPPTQPRIVGAASMHNMTHAFPHSSPAAKRPKT